MTALRSMLAILVSGSAIGCSRSEGPALSIVGTVDPSGTTMPTPVDLLVDTSISYELRMSLQVENLLEGASNVVSPLRFEIRWECDATGFRSEVGPLVLPSFDPVQAYCLDRRADPKTPPLIPVPSDSEFVGFDVIPGIGERIGPGARGVVTIVPVTYELGQAIDGLFRIAVLADQCCRATARCDGVTPMSAGTSLASCEALDGVPGGAPGIFDQLDPNRLRLKKFAAGMTNEDLTRFRPFATFDGSYALQFEGGSPRLLGDRYPMRMRAVLEGVTGDGAVVGSNEFTTTVLFCRACGPPPR